MWDPPSEAQQIDRKNVFDTDDGMWVARTEMDDGPHRICSDIGPSNWSGQVPDSTHADTRLHGRRVDGFDRYGPQACVGVHIVRD